MQYCSPCLISYQVSMPSSIMHRGFLKWRDLLEANAFQQSVYIGAANLFFTLLAMNFIDKVGRKKLLLIGAAGMIVFLGLTAMAFNKESGGGTAVIVYLIGFIAFFAFSQGAVIWVFISEIFPNSVRSQGGSLGSFTHWIMAAIISWTFPIIVEGSPKGGVLFLYIL